MVCEEEHHAGGSVDESHSTGSEVEARSRESAASRSRLLHAYVYAYRVALCSLAEHGAVTEV